MSSPGQAPVSWGVVVGAAAAGTAAASDRRAWEEQGRLPASRDGNGFASRYGEDLALFAEHGLSDVRLHLDWARVIPAQGRPDPAVLEALSALFDVAQSAGTRVWATLFDRSLPGWFVDEGGFADDRNRTWWSRWVELAADLVGDRVAGWMPLVEPVPWAVEGFLLGVAPPGRQDPMAFATAVRGVHLAWRDAWRILRGGPPVATAHRVGPIYASDPTIASRREARVADATYWGSWIDGLRDGIVRVPGRADEEVADLAGSGDLIGITYEGAVEVTPTGESRPYPYGARVAESGWAPWTEGLAITLQRVADELPGRPVVVAGHGIGTDDDEWRADVVREAVAVVTEARRDGIDLRGWFHHCGVDGYEWASGFAVPYGLVDRDRNAKTSLAALTEAVAALDTD